MSILQEAKQDVATALEATGITVYTVVPDNATTPCLLVAAGEPYLVTADVFGKHTVRLVVGITTDTGAKESITAELNTMIEQVLEALDGLDVRLQEVSQPEEWAVSNTTYLTTRVTVEADITLTKEVI